MQAHLQNVAILIKYQCDAFPKQNLHKSDFLTLRANRYKVLSFCLTYNGKESDVDYLRNVTLTQSSDEKISYAKELDMGNGFVWREIC